MKTKPTILISSPVYGLEELLDKVYSTLTAFGYEVWMSHKGTVPVRSDRTAFENCINAVENCNLFLGIIAPFTYGSGVGEGSSISISHEELREAIRLKKTRWLLTHDHVVFARSFLRVLGYKTKVDRKKLNLNKNNVFADLRIIDMYEEAILSELPLIDRKGNWVQKYETDDDAMLFTTSQFSRFQEIEEFIRENLSDPKAVMAKAVKNGGVK